MIQNYQHIFHIWYFKSPMILSHKWQNVANILILFVYFLTNWSKLSGYQVQDSTYFDGLQVLLYPFKACSQNSRSQNN